MEQEAYLNKARRIVADHQKISMEKIYVVWFAKTLQNWKALVSTEINDGLYFEVTYNGDQEEAYLDVYGRLCNHAVKD